MKVKLLPHQIALVMGRARYILLNAGLGSGKTYGGAERFVRYIREYPYTRGMLAGPLVQHIRKASYPMLKERCEAYGIDIKANFQTKTLHWDDTEAGIKGESDVVSLLEPNAARGPNLGYIWLDEGSLVSEEAWKILQGRVRCTKLPKEARSIWITSTPAGFTWLYDVFKGANSNWRNYQKLLLISCSTLDNTFLPEDYVEALLENYDSKFLQQEVYAKWLNISEGSVFYGFLRARNLIDRFVINQGKEFYVAIDFNVSPFVCSFWQKDAFGRLICFDSIELINADTYMMCFEIKNKINELGLKLSNIRVYPDPAAKQRRTSAKDLKTDLQILLDTFTKSVVYCSKSTIPIKASANVVNKMLEDGKLLIESTKRTTEVVKSLERTKYRQGSDFMIDKSGNIDHHSDAIRYMCYLMKYDTPLSIGYADRR